MSAEKKNILLVDDNAFIHKMYGTLLEGAGHGVFHAYDGIQAINMAFAEPVDLVLLDVNMPKINGYQVCRLLKDHPATRDIPIVIQTSSASISPVSDPRQWSFETGADSYMDKDEQIPVTEFIKPLLERPVPRHVPTAPLSEVEILTMLSRLLDKQLYVDITRLKELDERKNAFVANVSHEFKSPLAILNESLRLLQTQFGPVSDPKQARVFDISTRTVARLNRLVTDMLDLARIEAGKMQLRRTRFDLRGLLNEVVEPYVIQIEEQNITVVREYDKTPILIEADLDRLEQVFVNLFNNSLKFTPPGGTITIRAVATATETRVEMDDTGPGIAPEYIEKIFDKFERITSEKREGTGLGLPIARDIVTLHGGRLWAESELGKGSRFIVMLPK